jgi:hypothetical protein
LEVLIALVIIALAVGPVFGALLESIAGSAEQRGLAVVNTLLQSFAETAKSGIELSPPAGHGSLTGDTATSSILFAAGTTFVGDGINGAGISATTTIAAEDPTTHTATLSKTVTAEPTETLSIVPFRRCAQSYGILSLPSKLAGPVGSTVTVFGTGFGHTATLQTFSVTVGTQPVLRTTTPAHVWADQSQPKSDAHGNIAITFRVPSGLTPTPTPRTISLSGPSRAGTLMSVASLPGEGFTVTGGTATTGRSPDAGYTLGIVGITYWNPTTDTFEPTCTENGQTGRSGIQMITLGAAPPGGGSVRMSFVLRDSGYFATLIPTPTVVVTGKSAPRPYTRSTIEYLVFTAVVTPPSTNPAPTGTVTWKLTFPTSPTVTHSCPTESQITSERTLVATCKLPLTISSQFGSYTADATYSGDAYNQASSGSGTAVVYSPDGSGTMTVAPTAVLASSVNSLTFTYSPTPGGTGNGQVDVAIPTGWSIPGSTTTVTASGGTGVDQVTITGRRIEVSGVTLTAGQELTIIVKNLTAPSALGRNTFTAFEFSTAGATLTGLHNGSPVVVVTAADTVTTGAGATSGKTIVTPSFSMTAGASYLVYAFSSLSGSGDGASLSFSGFGSAPSPAKIGTQQFNATSDHAWLWYVKGTGGSGTVTVTLHNTIHDAYLEVVRLVGNGTPPYVTASKGFHVATTTGTTALATLARAPSSATDPEVIFLSAEGSLGTTPPSLPGFRTTANGFGHSTNGSYTVYTGLATRSESISIPPNWWGTMALEIHG